MIKALGIVFGVVALTFVSVTTAIYAAEAQDRQASQAFTNFNFEGFMSAYADREVSNMCKARASSGSLEDRSIKGAICLSGEGQACKQISCEMDACSGDAACISDWSGTWNDLNCDAIAQVCGIDVNPGGPRTPAPPAKVDCSKEGWLALGCRIVSLWAW